MCVKGVGWGVLLGAKVGGGGGAASEPSGPPRKQLLARGLQLGGL